MRAFLALIVVDMHQELFIESLEKLLFVVLLFNLKVLIVKSFNNFSLSMKTIPKVIFMTGVSLQAPKLKKNP